ncbi:hypothetical protein [Streptomyces sp. NRRL F-5126]|uniref:hypothetical protein n=1 Tax=Streptomyces sp. NRRL F-5126 TaxID=1463857 RepID=UPI00131D010D|nr:hypothetical protein [Streptomyces sp. NRRL F-5126]
MRAREDGVVMDERDEHSRTANSGHEDDGGGEPACMLELVCPECGQVRGDAGAQRPCQACGAGTPSAPNRGAARKQ